MKPLLFNTSLSPGLDFGVARRLWLPAISEVMLIARGWDGLRAPRSVLRHQALSGRKEKKQEQHHSWTMQRERLEEKKKITGLL